MVLEGHLENVVAIQVTDTLIKTQTNTHTLTHTHTRAHTHTYTHI